MFVKNARINDTNLQNYDKIDVSVCSDNNKTRASKECIICNYWYFSADGLSFNWMSVTGVMMYYYLNNIAILNTHLVDY